MWSVQPKRATDDRKKLVAMLRNLLKRLHGGLHNVTWESGEREQFMSNLVEAHAAAVKPSLASTPMPTDRRRRGCRRRGGRGDRQGRRRHRNQGARARRSDGARAAAAAARAGARDRCRIASPKSPASLERGMWVEFEGEDGQLAFAKLAWVSPLRGTYLFTNRQGQKAVSLTADELAERFRNDRARLVEAEPLVDRAFTSMIASIEEKFGDVATADARA